MVMWLCALTATVWVAGLTRTPAALGAERNLLFNGDFSRGSGDSLDGWRSDAWILTAGTTDYHWLPPVKGRPGEVEILTHHDNDARWTQQVTLGPGWYYISAEARTRDALASFIGANVSVLEISRINVISDDLKGDSDWRRLGLYLKVGAGGADIDVALRLGGYMNLTRGDAFFRDARVVKVGAPPAGAAHVFDLDKVRRSEDSGPHGSLWSLVATFAALAALAVVGWWMIGARAPVR
jgi:hypothetical protein